jgi:hypothetical protein
MMSLDRSRIVPAVHKRTLFLSRRKVTVHTEHMVGNLSVSILFDIISDDKQQIKPREQRVG